MYALVKAHEERKTIKEVVEMATELKPFSANNTGFKQFSEHYEFVATSEEVRDEYLKWQRELLRQAGIIEAAEERGEERGIGKGIDKAFESLVRLGLITQEQASQARTAVQT